ncbi:MAG: CvpA family protein [Planctomycetaceae bacterium]|jgi:hypothetical protein|nr:CvpA family protein [Planctomycetaceae bacterium]
MILTLILLAVFVTVTAALWKEGIWSSLVMLLNVVLAATVATAWYEKLVAVLEPRLPSFTYLLDFVALWGLFCLLLLGLREATDRISRTRVKLRRPVELFGGPLVAALVGWVMICFTAATLHTAPVPRDVVQPTPEARMFFGLAPDRKWLAWVRGATLTGPFAVPGSAFDKDADFIIRYADRRQRLEGEPGLRVNR